MKFIELTYAQQKTGGIKKFFYLNPAQIISMTEYFVDTGMKEIRSTKIETSRITIEVDQTVAEIKEMINGRSDLLNE